MSATRMEKTATSKSAPDLLTVHEVAEILRTSPGAVRQMISRGALPGVVHVGRRVLVRRVDLLGMVGL